jgi:hypothetical protein
LLVWCLEGLFMLRNNWLSCMLRRGEGEG